MSFKTHRLLALAAALLLGACAQDVGDINRVQPNVMKKSDLLDGTWYFRNSVTWTPATTNFTYPGQTGDLAKLVWEIQENNLVGYRSFPYIVGAESTIDQASKVSGTTATYCDKTGACTGGQKYYGAPVVAFAISSHFDIARNYNPATGEQGNVISENSSDRPWNQREFIRVDWSANLLNKNSGLNWGTVQNPAGGSSSSNWIQANEPGSDPTDWPSREYDKDGKLTYFDVTGRYMANPDLYYFEGWGYYPLCYLHAREEPSQDDCSTSEIKMRVSFAKVDTHARQDYEPLLYDNDLMAKFGYFRTERLNYDRKFGYTDSAIIRLANRHRIWQHYYQDDANGNADPTKPIDLAQRTPKPVVYYMTRADLMGGQENYDQYFVPAKKLEKNWDHAFRRAVAAAQGHGDDVSTTKQELFICDNPVAANADADTIAACGQPGFSPKFGDLRYSFVNTVAEPVANGLLGYGPMSADPETGEIISANANTYLWGLQLYGRSVLDQIDLLNGDTTTQDYISGKVMRDYLLSNPVYTQAKLQSGKIPAADQGLTSDPTKPNGPPRHGGNTARHESKGAFSKPTERMAALIGGLKATGGLPAYSQNAVQSAADTLSQYPQLESAVLDNPDAQWDVVGMLPSPLQAQAANDPEFRRKAARTVMTNIRGAADWEQQRLSWLTSQNITMVEFFDRTLVALAYQMKGFRTSRVAQLEASGDPACANASACTEAEATVIANGEISKQIRQNVWQSTMEHEIGHTFGLRHNFEGSFDAVNYFDNYWQLRKDSLLVQQNGNLVVPRTPADLLATSGGQVIQPGINAYDADATLEARLAGGIHDLEYSSIMDYAGKITGDWKGPGKYDEAAIIFGYSGQMAPGYVEVFNGARTQKQTFPSSDTASGGGQVTVTGAGLDLPLVNVTRTNTAVPNYTERFHYSTVPLHFGEGSDPEVAVADGIEKLKHRTLRKWAEVKAAEDQLKQVVAANPGIIDDPDQYSAEISQVPLEVPYMFCTDDHVGAVLACNRFDRGPDYFEMTRTHLEDYWNNYYATHFKRDRYNFSSYSSFMSAFNTFYEIANVYKHWTFAYFNQPTAQQQLTPHYPLDATMQDLWTMAVLDGLNGHINVMAVPPYGFFMFRNTAYGPRWDVLSDGVDYDTLNDTGKAQLANYYTQYYGAITFADLPRGYGRRMYSRYDFKSGFGFFDKLQEAGHYNDQTGAMFAAVIPDAYFLGVDDTADFRRYNIPYYLVFKPEMSETFGSLWSSQNPSVNPTMYLMKDSSGAVTTNATLAWRRFVKGTDIVQGFDYPADPLPSLTPDQQVGQAWTQITWTSRIYSLYLGEALFKVNYDLDYAKENMVYKLGGGEQMSIAPGYHTVEVPDVTTGSRYVAVEKDGYDGYCLSNGTPTTTACYVFSPGGAGGCSPTQQCVFDLTKANPAARLISNARDYLVLVNNPATCPLPAYLQYQGWGCMRADEANNPAVLEDRRKYWTDIFRDTIRDLDLMRGMYQAYGKAF